MSNVIPLTATASTLRILVVDDHLDGLHTLVKLLKTQGHTVAFAINGFAALAVAREFKPNVVILDMRLPDMSGLEVAQQLKFDLGLEAVRIIALSASAEFQQKAAALGIVEFVLKPVEPSVWGDLLEEGGRKRASNDAAGS